MFSADDARPVSSRITISQIRNSSQSVAATKDFRVAAQEDTLEAPGRHRPAATFADESYGLPKYTSD